VSSDDRKREINERELLMQQRNQLIENAGFEDESILLREQKEQAQEAEMMQEMQGKQEDKQLDQVERDLNNPQQPV